MCPGVIGSDFVICFWLNIKHFAARNQFKLLAGFNTNAPSFNLDAFDTVSLRSENGRIWWQELAPNPIFVCSIAAYHTSDGLLKFCDGFIQCLICAGWFR